MPRSGRESAQQHTGNRSDRFSDSGRNTAKRAEHSTQNRQNDIPDQQSTQNHSGEGYSPTWIDGKRYARNVYAKTREECEEKLKELIAEMKAEIAEAKALQKAGKKVPPPKPPKKSKKKAMKNKKRVQSKKKASE